MSFTQDELQALNTIFDQKMAILRRDLERSLDQRMLGLRRDFEHRLTLVLQDLLRGQSRRLFDLHHKSRDSLYQRLELQQARTSQLIQQETEQRQRQQQQLEDIVERGLAAQLLAFEQLLNQRLSSLTSELPVAYSGEAPPDFDAIEVQTEIPWEDLVDLIARELDERLNALSTLVLDRLRAVEGSLLAQFHSLSVELHQRQSPVPGESSSETAGNIQHIVASLEQLERLIEAMQVTMTANSALISNRLFHHQQLPLEQAHPSRPITPPVQAAEPPAESGLASST